jgi:hypothetical protein
VDGTTDFDGVVWIGGRETQDTCCGVYLADVGYGDRLDIVLARFGCCTILVRNRVVCYCGHCSFDGGPGEMRWRDS